MKLFDITIKDLLRFFRSPFALVMMFVAPLIFPALIYLAFGNMTSSGAGGGFDIPQVQVIIANLDQTDPQSGWSASKLLVEYLESQEVAAVMSVTSATGEAEARRAVQQQKADVAVIIPAGFTSAALVPNGTAEIVLVNEPTLKIGPGIVRSVISGNIESLSGAKIAVRVTDAQMAERGVTMSEDAARAVTGQYITWVQAAARDRSEASTASLVRLTSPEGHPAAAITSSGMIGPIMAAMIIFFVFFTAANGASRLIQEEEDGTLTRLLTTPTHLSTILSGTFLFVLVTLGFQSAVLFMAARLLFGIRWGSPLSLSLAVLALIVAASGLGFFLISVIRNTRQAGVVQGGVLTIMAMVGGLFTAFMADMPAALTTISLITPQGWALHSLKLVLTGAALDEVLPALIILLIMGLLFSRRACSISAIASPERSANMPIIALTLKDILQIALDWKTVLFLVLMPVAFTLFFGFTMSGSISDPRLPVGWINDDAESPLSTGLFQMLEKSTVIRLVPLQASETSRASEQVRDEKLAATVHVPAGFSTKALTGEAIPIKVVILPGSPAGATARTAIQAAINRLLSAVTISQISTEVFEAQQPFQDSESCQAYTQQALVLANRAWEKPSFTIRDDPTTETSLQAHTGNRGFLQSSPGMIVMFAIFGLTTCSMVLFLERKSGALERLLTTPVRRAEIIGGHLLAVFLVVFLQEFLLVAFGQFFFGVNYLREPAGTLLMMDTLALWVASLGLLIGVISKSAEQVILWSMVAMFLFSALGGTLFPLEIAGRVFATVGHFTPAAWAMDGFQNIVLRGQGSVSTLFPAGMLLGFAGAFFAAAVWRFRYEST